ncbi:reverse transcriptase domain-containing protein [Tanacetum coccineum]
MEYKSKGKEENQHHVQETSDAEEDARTPRTYVAFGKLNVQKSIDSYNDLREAFLKNYLQQKKCIRDPIVLHNIKQRDGESTEDFIQRYKSESGNVKGAPECMRISGFVHGITNPELIKRFHEKIPKIVDEMMQVATSFLQGQEAASNQERKKVPPAWRHQEGGHRQNFKKGGGFRSQHKQEKRPDRFTLLTKTPKEILALEKGKFKTPPPMTTPVEKRNANKFCEFHGEVGHNTDECNHLRKQIEDMLKAGKLSHIIRELKQSSGKEQPKKKGETSGKEKPQAILMIQSRQEAIRQKVTQSFSPNSEMLFPHLRDDEGAEGPLIIEAEIGGHQVHRMCVDGGSSFEILYEHCFNRLRPEIKNQMVPATTSLIGFRGEIKWPLGQITLLVKIGDDEHSTSAWMDFMVKLNGKLARDLNRFLAKSAEKSLPFFKTLKKCTKKSDFLWTKEAKAAFRQMKQHIAQLPMLTALEEQEELIVYVAASKEEGRKTKGRKSARFRKGRRIAPGTFTYALRFQFEATNNEAEYEALIAGLRIAEKMGIQNLEVKVDSKLVANQVNGTYVAKETDMIKYLEKVKALASTFRVFLIKQVLRSKNKKADALCKMASLALRPSQQTGVVEGGKKLKEKSMNESEVLAVVEEEEDSWMTPIHEYLTDETLPAKRKKARAIKRKSQRFAIINGILYKKSFLGPWLRCVGPLQANYVLQEIHESSCNMHVGT